MAIALLLPEKCDYLKLWFGKPVHCNTNAFLLLLLHQVIVLKFSRLTSVIIGFAHSSDSRCMVFNMYHVLGKATQAILWCVALD